MGKKRRRGAGTPGTVAGQPNPNLDSVEPYDKTAYENIVNFYKPNSKNFVKIFESDDSLNRELASMVMVIHRLSILNPFSPETARQIRALINACVFLGSRLHHRTVPHPHSSDLNYKSKSVSKPTTPNVFTDDTPTHEDR